MACPVHPAPAGHNRGLARKGAGQSGFALTVGTQDDPILTGTKRPTGTRQQAMGTDTQGGRLQTEQDRRRSIFI